MKHFKKYSKRERTMMIISEVTDMGKIVLRLDRVMADRKMSLNELSEKVGVSNVNLSKIKTGKTGETDRVNVTSDDTFTGIDEEVKNTTWEVRRGKNRKNNRS